MAFAGRIARLCWGLLSKSGLLIVVAACVFLGQGKAEGRTIHVDARRGDDARDGSSQSMPLRTLQRAAAIVQPGDTVLVASGTYHGPVLLRTKGTPEKPIVFRAGELGENSVLITNADPAIRAGEVKWTLEDPSLGLYSAPYTEPWPARVLYSGTDLFPYMDLEHLKTFTGSSSLPGPLHGYTLDPVAGKLYVRLHASGRYGSPDPNEHVMAVAPPNGTQFDGTFISEPHHYCTGVLGQGPAYLTFDGFTFETPGVAGVYVEASHVTVRRCWFRGCRTGVAGNYTDHKPTAPDAEDAYARDYITMRLNRESQATAAANIIVEYCDFSQFPLFEDAADGIREHGQRACNTRKADRRGGGALPNDHFKYEIGIAARIARDWTIRRNFVHSVFDGLSCHAVSASQRLRVEENVFQGVADNGVECEDHAQEMYVVRNVFLDNFMPFSYQPLRGTPWPGPIFFTQNVVLTTPEYRDLWKDYKMRVAFKIHVFKLNVEWLPRLAALKGVQQKARDPGLIIANNTVFLPGGEAGLLNGVPNQLCANNVLVLACTTHQQRQRRGRSETAAADPRFHNNVVAPTADGEPGPGPIIAGQHGQTLSDVAALKWDDRLRPAADSPLRGKAVPVPEAGLELHDIGAVQAGDTWYPLQVGPMAARKAERFGPNGGSP